MKQRFAKIIALALAVIMIVTAFPVSAYTGAQDSANANDSKAAKDFLDWIAGSIADQFKPIYPAQSMDHNVLGGTSVHVDAPRGALPADTELDVVTIADLDAVQDAFNAASDERGHVFTAVDINFINNGEEVDPRKPVTVILDNSVIANLENIRLVHFKGGADEIDTAEMETVEQFYVSGQTITFDAEDFSVYAVIGDGHQSEYSRLQVRFFHHDDDTEPAYVVNVTQRDIDILGTIIEDPELPEVNEGEMFCGWSVGNAYTTADIDGQHTIDYIREQVAARLASPVTEGQTFDVYAMVFKYFNIAYVDENGATTLDFQTVFSKDSSINYTIYHLYAPEEQGYRFTGWQKDDGDDTVYQNNSEVTITNTLTTLRAQVQQGYWLTFEENPGENFKGATYNAPIFCPYGNIPSNARPTPNPELAGYDFGGWYTTYANGTWSNQFSFTGTISQDTTVYAKWTLKASVPYTLIVWKQSVNDNKNAADSAKTYDYAFSTTLNAAPNTNVSALDLS
ncbi:MAG: InlB B-repeat-containing protein, partial [Clostridia bacterium]|nr:InlB B-repeat-containing protein [Clostridia bacterium]